MTRLEAHRRRWESEGRLGNLLRLEDLDRDEVALVNRTFLDRCRSGGLDGVDGIYAAYALALHEWGVMCPHPQHQRLYDGWHRTDVPLQFSDSGWYDCGLCGSAVINR